MKEDDLSMALMHKIEERFGQLSERLKQPPPPPAPENEKTESKSPSAVKKTDPHYLCLLVGAYLDESVPEMKKTAEIELLSRLYKAKLAILSGNQEAATALLKGTQKALKAAIADTALFPPSMNKTVNSHYLALIRSLKAELALTQGNVQRAIVLTTKNKEGFPIHPSQHKPASKDVSLVTSFTHPVHQYNNLGVIHLRLKKYALALTYFQTVFFCCIIA